MHSGQIYGYALVHTVLNLIMVASNKTKSALLFYTWQKSWTLIGWKRGELQPELASFSSFSY